LAQITTVEEFEKYENTAGAEWQVWDKVFRAPAANYIKPLTDQHKQEIRSYIVRERYDIMMRVPYTGKHSSSTNT